MDEQAARDIALVRAIEAGDAEHAVLTADDRRYASRAAGELAHWQAADQRRPPTAELFLARRAGLLLDRLVQREPVLRALRQHPLALMARAGAARRGVLLGRADGTDRRPAARQCPCLPAPWHPRVEPCGVWVDAGPPIARKHSWSCTTLGHGTGSHEDRGAAWHAVAPGSALRRRLGGTRGTARQRAGGTGAAPGSGIVRAGRGAGTVSARGCLRVPHWMGEHVPHGDHSSHHPAVRAGAGCDVAWHAVSFA